METYRLHLNKKTLFLQIIQGRDCTRISAYTLHTIQMTHRRITIVLVEVSEISLLFSKKTRMETQTRGKTNHYAFPFQPPHNTYGGGGVAHHTKTHETSPLGL